MMKRKRGDRSRDGYEGVCDVVVVVVAEKRSLGRAHIPCGGSGGSRGPCCSRGGRVLKADREVRCLATCTGFSHRSLRERVVGAALHSNRRGVVWGSDLHSGQMSVGDSPMVCLYVSSLEQWPDLS